MRQVRKRRKVVNYGLHWRKDLVEWGRQGPGGAGRLLGKAKGESKPVDFAEQRGVYALYSDYELLYIGHTANQALLLRLRQHRDDHLSERWNRFSWFGTRIVNKRKLAEQSKDSSSFEDKVVIATLEAVCIAIAEPRLNLQRGAWPRPYKQFYQFREGKE